MKSNLFTKSLSLYFFNDLTTEINLVFIKYFSLEVVPNTYTAIIGITAEKIKIIATKSKIRITGNIKIIETETTLMHGIIASLIYVRIENVINVLNKNNLTQCTINKTIRHTTNTDSAEKPNRKNK